MIFSAESDIARTPDEVFVTPRGEGSHVESRFDFRPKGPMKLMFPLMQSAIRKDIAKQSELQAVL